MHAPLDRIGEVGGSERDRGGEQRDVARAEAVNRLLVGVEADERSILWHIDSVLELLLGQERLLLDAQPFGKNVSHRHDLEVAARHGEGIDRGPGAAAAAADHGHADLVVAGGMGISQASAAEQRADRGGGQAAPRNVAQECAAAGGGRGGAC